MTTSIVPRLRSPDAAHRARMRLRLQTHYGLQASGWIAQFVHPEDGLSIKALSDRPLPAVLDRRNWPASFHQGRRTVRIRGTSFPARSGAIPVFSYPRI